MSSARSVTHSFAPRCSRDLLRCWKPCGSSRRQDPRTAVWQISPRGAWHPMATKSDDKPWQNMIELQLNHLGVAVVNSETQPDWVVTVASNCFGTSLLVPLWRCRSAIDLSKGAWHCSSGETDGNRQKTSMASCWFDIPNISFIKWFILLSLMFHWCFTVTTVGFLGLHHLVERPCHAGLVDLLAWDFNAKMSDTSSTNGPEIQLKKRRSRYPPVN